MCIKEYQTDLSAEVLHQDLHFLRTCESTNKAALGRLVTILHDKETRSCRMWVKTRDGWEFTGIRNINVESI